MLNEYNFIECVIYRCFVQFFFISSFLWTCCIAHHLYRETYQLSKINNPYFKIYHGISWGISLIIIIVLVADSKIVPSTQSWCHLDNLFEIYFWIIPITASIAWNAVFYGLIIRRIFWVFSSRVTDSVDNGSLIKSEAIKKLSLLLLVFIICWLPDMVNHILNYFFNICPPDYAVVIQDLLGPLQGFLNSWVYGYSNNEFRATYQKFLARFTKRNLSLNKSESLSLMGNERQ